MAETPITRTHRLEWPLTPQQLDDLNAEIDDIYELLKQRKGADAPAHAILSTPHADATPTTPATGDLIVYEGSAWRRHPIGAAGDHLQVAASLPAWSKDGSTLTALNASNLASGTVPLARLVDLTNAQIAAAAAIDWTKISKAGSSLADLATRSAGDLTTGTLDSARLADAGVVAATYGSITQVPQLTFDAKGRATAAANITLPDIVNRVILTSGVETDVLPNSRRIIVGTGLAVDTITPGRFGLDLAPDFSAIGIWETWTPTWTNLTVGNSVVTARRARHQKTVCATIGFTLGSTGGLSPNVQVSLPYTSTTVIGNVHACGVILMRDGSTGSIYAGRLSLVTGAAQLLGEGTPMVAVGTTIPFTWDTGDEMFLVFVYEGV